MSGTGEQSGDYYYDLTKETEGINSTGSDEKGRREGLDSSHQRENSQGEQVTGFGDQ